MMADSDGAASNAKSNTSSPRDTKGWDGKLRITKQPLTTHDTSDSSPHESENEDGEEETSTAAAAAVGYSVTDVPGGSIDADGDLLDGVDSLETDIDLNHNRISSIPALRLERFKEVVRLCLRQNQISLVEFPGDWASAETLKELDLYDNGISHIRGLESFTELTSLDLSFNSIKHIKRVGHLKKLKDLYFVQNKIGKIEGLDELTALENLELGGNRIREVENLDKLTNLRELWLGKNKVTELKNLSHLQNLTLLSIQSNRLTSPSLSHLTSLPNLSDLYLSHNALTTLIPLTSGPILLNLRTLDVCSNPISSLAGLAPLINLEEFWASNCELESFEEIGEELKGMQGLETVYFEGNPLEKRQRALYRGKVRLALPEIKQIDATFVRAS